MQVAGSYRRGEDLVLFPEVMNMLAARHGIYIYPNEWILTKFLVVSSRPHVLKYLWRSCLKLGTAPEEHQIISANASTGRENQQADCGIARQVYKVSLQTPKETKWCTSMCIAPTNLWYPGINYLNHICKFIAGFLIKTVCTKHKNKDNIDR